jgi:pectinesterase
MKIKIKNIYIFHLIIFIHISLAFAKNKVRTIFIIGDSTAAKKDTKNGKVERGWGMMLQNCFDKNYIKVDNHAVNGASSLSFISGGRWKKVLQRIRPGDFVVIQFGHNDEKSGQKKHTDPGSTFNEVLSRYCNETRELGGIPILMNCVVRRNFAKNTYNNGDDEALRNTTYADGAKVEEADILIDTHGDYRFAPITVAKELNVYFVDANKITHELEQGLGVEGSKKLHMWFLPGQERSEIKGKKDNTHYNIYGAQVVANLLADGICEEIPELKKYRKYNSSK